MEKTLRLKNPDKMSDSENLSSDIKTENYPPRDDSFHATPENSPPRDSFHATPENSPPRESEDSPIYKPGTNYGDGSPMPGSDELPSIEFAVTSPAYRPKEWEVDETDSPIYQPGTIYGNYSPLPQSGELPSIEFADTSPAYRSKESERGLKNVEQYEPKPEKKRQSKKIIDIYSRTLVAKKISVEMKYIGSNIKELLEKKLKEAHEGKCISEGYVKKNTIKIITYSSGKICTSGVLYEVSFECYVCFPVEGQLLNCVATNITKAGIKATSLESPSPFIVFISRDHQLSNKKFNTIGEKDHFVARIIGQRFELNDPYISIIAEIDEKKRYIKNI